MHDSIDFVNIDEKNSNAKIMGVQMETKATRKRKISHATSVMERAAMLPINSAGNETSASATVLANNGIIGSDEEEEENRNNAFTFMSFMCYATMLKTAIYQEVGHCLITNQPSTCSITKPFVRTFTTLENL